MISQSDLLRAVRTERLITLRRQDRDNHVPDGVVMLQVVPATKGFAALHDFAPGYPTAITFGLGQIKQREA